jgi:hypothetical protein
MPFLWHSYRMPRQPNKIETTQFTVSTTPPIRKLLEDLVATGLYGKNIAEAAERLIADSIRQLIGAGTLRKQRRTARRSVKKGAG